MIGLASCGKIVNSKASNKVFIKALSFNLLEHKCANNPGVSSDLFKKISALLVNAQASTVRGLWVVNTPVPFDYIHPMVVSLEDLENEYNQIARNSGIRSMDEILSLYNKAQRFEDLRCFFGTLVNKQSGDLRPYYTLRDYCSKENADGTCAESEYANNDEVKKNILQICESFNSKFHCLLEFSMNQRASTLAAFANRYQQKFVREKIDTLFQLRPSHSIFSCQKNQDQIVMNVEVFAPGFNQQLLQNLLAVVEQTWTSQAIKVQIKILQAPTANSVQIISIANGISHVPNDNNHIVYLNTTLPTYTMSLVLSHEFGHVLGFPDCYIEFFDIAKKELVYYELDANNMDIMCSLKSEVSVPADYFSQLAQSSCNFR